MKPQTGTLIIPDDNNKTTILDDGLHAFVCPHCGSNVFDSTDIVSYDNYEERVTYRCWGGFGCITYRWIPHKCMACNTKFLAWKATKSINWSVIRCYIALILFAILVMFLSTGLAIGLDKIFLLADIPGLILFILWIRAIEAETYDADIGLEKMIEFADFPDEEKESSSTAMALDILRRNKEETESIIAESIRSACMASPNELRTAMMEGSACARKSHSL